MHGSLLSEVIFLVQKQIAVMPELCCNTRYSFQRNCLKVWLQNYVTQLPTLQNLSQVSSILMLLAFTGQHCSVKLEVLVAT